jgi:hypothetical protein
MSQLKVLVVGASIAGPTVAYVRGTPKFIVFSISVSILFHLTHSKHFAQFYPKKF